MYRWILQPYSHRVHNKFEQNIVILKLTFLLVFDFANIILFFLLASVFCLIYSIHRHAKDVKFQRGL